MTGTTRVISSIFLVLILSGCMKTHCVAPNKCEKAVDGKSSFKLLRTLLTNGSNLGK
jgi:PBP1b-binding outer membrane lipoprotein LpoB